MTGPRPLADAFRAIATIARNRGLRILNLAWAGSITGEYLTLTGLGIYGFGAHGAAGVGAVAVAQMLPAILVAPFAAALGDRFRRERVLAGAEVVRALASLLAALAVAADAGTVPVYVLAGILGASRTAYYPAQAALIPLLARDAREITASGAAINFTKNLANLAAPALAGLLLLVWSLATVFLVAAGAFVLAAGLVVLRLGSTAGLRVPATGGARLGAVSAGLRTARRDPSLRLPLLLGGAQGAGRGAINVLVIVIPLQLLGMQDSGAGFYSALIGAGGMVGVAMSLGLVGRRALAVPMALGLLAMGAPYLLPAAAPYAWPAAVALLVAGIGNAVMGVSGLSLLVRESRDDVLARVMGVLELVRAAGIILASIGIPVLISLMGLRQTLVVAAVLLGGLALLSLPAARRLDVTAAEPPPEAELLSRSPLFERLLPVSLDRIARRMRRLPVRAGDVLIREGDAGDRVYLATAGSYEVSAAGRHLNTLARGDVFGEIALLRETPRTATVRATSDGEVLWLDRTEFLSAVLGHPLSSEDARALASTRLEHGGAAAAPELPEERTAGT